MDIWSQNSGDKCGTIYGSKTLEISFLMFLKEVDAEEKQY